MDRDRLKQLNPDADDATLDKAVEATRELAPSAKPRAGGRDPRAEGWKRDQTGKLFQRELDATHDGYLAYGGGFILRQHGPFVRTQKRGWQPGGYARCDYAGHVNLLNPEVYSEPLRLGIGGVPAPIYFDAKVLGTRHATYQHAVEQQHQLTDLRAALNGGGYAFLLVCAREVERAFVVGIAEHFDDLMRGRGVTLFEQKRYGGGGYAKLVAEPLLPACEWTAASGWHWAPLLRFIQRGKVGP
jgi:hypothetical protein